MTPAPDPDARAADVAAIRARRAKRREPQIGTCQSCGHQRPMNTGPAPSSIAEAQWRCEKCGGQVAVTMILGATGPTPDDDIDTLLASVEQYQQAFAYCDVHGPDLWEGDGTCVICEAVEQNRHLAAREEALAALKTAMLGLQGSPATDPCWCGYSAGIGADHDEDCQRARGALLSQASSR